jgi:hypothetical protein
MSWWKILILYILFLGGLLWFMYRSRGYCGDRDEAQGD